MAEDDKNKGIEFSEIEQGGFFSRLFGVSAQSNHVIKGTPKKDIVYLADGGKNNKADLGEGNDFVMTSSYADHIPENHEIDMGADDDRAILTYGKNLTVDQGAGNDSASSGNEKYDNGEPIGSKSHQLNNSKVSQGAGDDELEVRNQFVRSNLFDGGDGLDKVSISGKRDDFDITFKILVKWL